MKLAEHYAEAGNYELALALFSSLEKILCVSEAASEAEPPPRSNGGGGGGGDGDDCDGGGSGGGMRRQRSFNWTFEYDEEMELAEVLKWTGRLNYMQGNHAACLASMRRALAITQRLHGENHPEVIIITIHLSNPPCSR